MKKILLIIGFILITLAGFTQTTTGWAQQRSKVNFKDSINIAKGWMIDGVIVLPSVAEINFLDGVTSVIQTQLDARKYMPYDFLIEEVAGVTYARPNPNTAYTASSNAVPSVVINAVMAQLTTGGIIQFSAGTFDNCDSIVVPYDNIMWRGAGKSKTILKLKASFDADKKVSDGFIQVIEKDYFAIKDMDIDGNGANQTKIDNGASAGLAIICGVESEDTRYLTIDNCYIHDFTETGIFSSGCDWLTVKNSHIKDNYWNGITFGWGTDYNVLDNCLVEGSGDVGVTMYGRNNEVKNNQIRYITGTKGYDNSQVSIAFEAAGDDPYVRSQYHLVTNNIIKGAGQKAGITSNAIGEGSLGVAIEGNYIDSCEIAISMMGDSSTIVGNKIVTPQGGTYNYGIYIQDGDYNFVSANDITCRTIGSGDYPILLTNTSDGADYNKIVGNNLKGGTYYSIGVAHANCDGNIIMGNVFNDATDNADDIYDIGTGTIKGSDNYDIHSARFNPIVTGDNRTVNYTGNAASVDFGTADLTTTGSHTSATVTTGILINGDATSNTIASLDSTAYVGSELAHYDGADTLNSYIPFANRSIGIALADTTNNTEGNYMTRQNYHNDPSNDNSVKVLKSFGTTIKAYPVSPPGANIASGLVLTDARAWYLLFYIPEKTTLTGIRFQITVAGDFTGDEFNGVGLYGVSGTDLTLVAVSANDHTIFENAALAVVSVAFTSPYVASPGFYYAAMLYNESAHNTVPSLYSLNNVINILNNGAFGDSKEILGVNASETTLATPLTTADIYSVDISYAPYMVLY